MISVASRTRGLSLTDTVGEGVMVGGNRRACQGVRGRSRRHVTKRRLTRGRDKANRARLDQAELIDVGKRRPLVAVLGAVRILPEIVWQLLHGERPSGAPDRLTLLDTTKLPMNGGGWVLLGERPEDEFALGLVGKVWRPVTKYAQVDAATFKEFAEPGFAKTIYALGTRPREDGKTLLWAIMRTATTDEPARTCRLGPNEKPVLILDRRHDPPLGSPLTQTGQAWSDRLGAIVDRCARPVSTIARSRVNLTLTLNQHQPTHEHEHEHKHKHKHNTQTQPSLKMVNLNDY